MFIKTAQTVLTNTLTVLGNPAFGLRSLTIEYAEFLSGRIAQLEERRFDVAKVVGSNPASTTTRNS